MPGGERDQVGETGGINGISILYMLRDGLCKRDQFTHLIDFHFRCLLLQSLFRDLEGAFVHPVYTLSQVSSFSYSAAGGYVRPYGEASQNARFP